MSEANRMRRGSQPLPLTGVSEHFTLGIPSAYPVPCQAPGMTQVIPWPSAYPQAHHPKPTQGLRGEGTSPLIPLSHRPWKTAFCRNVVFPRVWLQFRCRNVVLWLPQSIRRLCRRPQIQGPWKSRKIVKKSECKKILNFFPQEVPGSSKLGPRAPKIPPKSTPGGIRRGPQRHCAIKTPKCHQTLLFMGLEPHSGSSKNHFVQRFLHQNWYSKAI